MRLGTATGNLTAWCALVWLYCAGRRHVVRASDLASTKSTGDDYNSSSLEQLSLPVAIVERERIQVVATGSTRGVSRQGWSEKKGPSLTQKERREHRLTQRRLKMKGSSKSGKGGKGYKKGSKKGKSKKGKKSKGGKGYYEGDDWYWNRGYGKDDSVPSRDHDDDSRDPPTPAVLVDFNGEGPADEGEVLPRPPVNPPVQAPVPAITDGATRPDNVAILIGSRDNLSTFDASLKMTGLSSLLMGTDSQYTVFAPSNDAFLALENGTAAVLHRDQFLPHCISFLLYHIVKNPWTTTDLTNGTGLVAANNETLRITGPNPLLVNGERFGAVDLTCGNGVVHVLSTGVLLPSWVTSTIFSRIAVRSSTSQWMSILIIAEYDVILADSGALTHLAPTNDALGRLDGSASSMLADATASADSTALKHLVGYHTVKGVFTFEEFLNASVDLNTLAPGKSIEVELTGGQVSFNSMAILESFSGILANNGIVHGISTLLVPPA
jgi:uncharacterized surface protein with fasciclin (FAS1) repeats